MYRLVLRYHLKTILYYYIRLLYWNLHRRHSRELYHRQTMAAQSKTFRIAENVSRSKDVPWFQSKIGSSLTPAGRSLLEAYSGIPASEVEAHIYKTVRAPPPYLQLPCSFILNSDTA